MQFGFQPKARSRISAGLDIGTREMKIVEISTEEGKPIVTALGKAAIPSGAKEDISAALKGLAISSKLNSKDINISVYGPSVITRFLTMPKMSKEEMSGAIRFEAEKHIPFNINECVTDFQVLQEYPKDNKSDVLLVAVKRDYVEGRVKAVREAGFGIGVVDVDGLAVANAFLKNYSQKASQERTSLLLDIGANITHLAILKGQVLRLVRDVSIGSKDFNLAISKVFGVDHNDIEKLKQLLKDKPDEALVPLRGAMNNLFDEVRLSCSYYENQCGRNIDDIYISGGGSGIDGLPVLFQESFGVKPECLDPFQAFNIVNFDSPELQKLKSHYAVAVGLAIR